MGFSLGQDSALAFVLTSGKTEIFQGATAEGESPVLPPSVMEYTAGL